MSRISPLVFMCAALLNAGCDQVYPYDARPAPDASVGDGAGDDFDGASASGLRVVEQPAEAYEGLPLYPPPTIALNGGTSGTEVTLSVMEGTGRLSGKTRVETVDGIAVFEGLIYDKIETAVVLLAKSGSESVELAPFAVVAPPPGACEKNDTHLTTALGGCHDRRSGLAWSALQTQGKWHEAVWDAQSAGSPPPDEHDQGWTNDYPVTTIPCPGACDASSAAICHALSEGNQRDWRTPTLAELTELHNNLGLGSGDYLPRPDGVWTSNSSESGTYGVLFSLVSGTSVESFKSSAADVICVRGGREPAAKLVIDSAPFATGNGTPLPTPIIVAVTDAAGKQVNAGGITVELISDPASALKNPGVRAVTDASGRATFRASTLSTSSSLPQRVELTASAPELTAVRHELTIGAERHTCRPGGAFVTAAGGCQHELTGLVFSAPALDAMTWYEAVWDSTSPSGNVQPDTHDGNATNDYDPDVPVDAAASDASIMNYCHELEEGGALNWRLPSVSELTAARAAGAPSRFGFPTDDWFWSSTIHPAGNLSAVAVWLGEERERDIRPKKVPAAVLCVRRP